MRRVRNRSLVRYKTQSFGGWGGLFGGQVGSRLGSRLGGLLGKRFGKSMADKFLPKLAWQLGAALFPSLPLFLNKKGYN